MPTAPGLEPAVSAIPALAAKEEAAEEECELERTLGLRHGVKGVVAVR
jgi:hypothetical protein